MAERILDQNDTDERFSEIVKKQFPDQVYITSDGTIDTRASRNPEGYLLGSPELPVAQYRELIVDTVANNVLTIITSGTGTGKSTNVPQFLFESGRYDRVAVTQPRVVASRELKFHVGDDIAGSLGDRDHNLVGFQTAVEGDSTDENAIVYVTDGLQLMHEIYNNGITKDQILVIDEFHERSVNMDTLLAIAVKKGIRTVVMSATLDAQNLSDHYTKIIGSDVPVIDIPGKTYDVTERVSDSLESEVITAAKAGKNILVFLPGRREIAAVMAKVRRKVPDAYTLLALHGDQTPDEQRKVMARYPAGKIIFSTSVGQTSITIADIDTVVDCGYERTGVIDEDGVETLATIPASRATSEQRRGRVGRTHEGEYILAQLKGYPPIIYGEAQHAYDVPEIRRARLDELVLKLAAFGETINSLPYYEIPEPVEIERAHTRLERLGMMRRSLGATALSGFEPTVYGEKAAKLPLDAHSARMVIEARKYGKDIELQMMAAAAVAQINGITSTVKGLENWRTLTKEKTSDLIAGIDFMVEALRRTENEQRDKHIIKLRYDKALRSFEQLARRRNMDIYDLVKPDDRQREALVRSIIAGTDELFTKSGKLFMDQRTKRRKLAYSTIIKEGETLLVGTPYNLQQARTKSIATHALVSSASVVTFELLMEVVPDRTRTRIDKLYINSAGVPMTDQTLIFDDHVTRHVISKEAEASPQLLRFMLESIFSTRHLEHASGSNIKETRRLIGELRRLQHRTTEDLGVDYSITQIINSLMHNIDYTSTTFDQVDPFIDIEAVKNIVPDDIRQEILADAPDSITIDDNGRPHKFHVGYYDNYARITIPPRFYHLVPFVIGNNHRVRVRPSENITHYVPLENARDAYEEKTAVPNRAERRGKKLGSDNKYPV